MPTYTLLNFIVLWIEYMGRGTTSFPILFAPLNDPTNIQVLPMGDTTDHMVGDYSELASGDSGNAVEADNDYVESLQTQNGKEKEAAEGVTQATKTNQK
jgi:hypothetical protein